MWKIKTYCYSLWQRNQNMLKAYLPCIIQFFLSIFLFNEIQKEGLSMVIDGAGCLNKLKGLLFSAPNLNLIFYKQIADLQ